MYRDFFYIAGYDPRAFRYYYLNLKKNLHVYNKTHNANLNISQAKQEKKHLHSFFISSSKTKCSYHILSWNDIVKKHWHKGFLSVMKDYFEFIRIYLLSGLFLRFFRLSKYAFLAGAYPFSFISFIIICAFLCLFYIFTFVDTFIYQVLILFVFFYLAYKLMMSIGSKKAIFWILRLCVFCAHLSKIKELKTRARLFADDVFLKLKENEKKDDYELVLCAHSVGTIVLVFVLARLLKSCEREKISYSKLKILSLGECIPLASLHKKALDFNEDLNYVARHKLIWLDYTSKIDGACFYLLDFFKASLVKECNLDIKFLSAKFYKSYTKLEYKKLKRKWYRVHFLYLEPPMKKNSSYDFFDIISSFLPLESRS